MSKAKLKKELVGFSKEQLIELMLNVYDSSKEAKDYFEFFLEPDIDSLIEKKIAEIRKETQRSKWGYSKARISRIKAEIKSFEGYGVSAEYVMKLRFFAIRSLVFSEKFLEYSPAFINSVDKFVADCLEYAAKNNMLLDVADDLKLYVIDNLLAGTTDFRSHLDKVFNASLSALADKYGLSL